MGHDAQGDSLMLLHAQCGVIDRGQAESLGFTNSQIRHRVRSGSGNACTTAYTRPLADRCRARRAFGPPSAGRGRERCSVMRRPPKSRASSTSRSVPRCMSPSPAVVGPCRASRFTGWSSTAPTSRPQFPGGSWKLPRTRVEDTVLDLVAAAATFERAYSWIARAVAKDLVTVAVLRATLADRSRMRWRSWVTDALEDSREGVASPLERRYIKDVERAHGLPKAERQARRTIGGRTHYKDNWYAEYLVAVEIDGPLTIRATAPMRTRAGTIPTWPWTPRRPTGSALWASPSAPARAPCLSLPRCDATAGQEPRAHVAAQAALSHGQPPVTDISPGPEKDLWMVDAAITASTIQDPLTAVRRPPGGGASRTVYFPPCPRRGAGRVL